MGKKVTYQCNKCDYSAHISGGRDVGMIVKTNTYVCDKCKEIVDVITEFWTDVATDESAIGKCPKCNFSKYLKEWDNKKCPCPKCDGIMKVSSETEITMWD